MPDRRSHRGPDPRDDQAFAPAAWPQLQEAVADLSWLLGRDYSPHAALKLVGDRWNLTQRQRLAVLRSSCGDPNLTRRACHRCEPEELAGEPLAIDGFNLLTTVEAALGGAVVLLGRDGALRDVAGLHGTYRRVEETEPAIRLVGDVLASLNVETCLWYLDRPVSNSGRLRGLLLEMAAARGWRWEVEVVNDPDPILKQWAGVAATSDSVILDACRSWVSLARFVVEERVPRAQMVPLVP